jgi:uncharacterized protein (TIGR02421 family)
MIISDAIVADAARSVRVLSTLSWPASVEADFLHKWRAGRRELPTPPPVPAPPTDERLGEVMAGVDSQDPLQAFVGRTAAAYRTATSMLQAAGTPDFSRHACALYGAPDDRIGAGPTTVLEEARHLLSATDALNVPRAARMVEAGPARDQLQRSVDAHFERRLPVVLDAQLGSLAAAGARRIRIRGGMRWAPAQLEQLLQHEALVHSATKRNGRRQPLKTLGLSSPRTTAVQEGLATLAEMVTDCLDLHRLRRIALRVEMVHRALAGADFLQVFEAMLDEEPEQEAFRSTMRVFRGGDVRGGVAFTKDVVYLSGLRQVHSFLLAALRAHRPELSVVLFAGRMTCGDAVALAPLLADGTLQPAAVMPPWVRRTDRLAAYLAWAAFGQRVEPMELGHFR